MAGLLSSAPLLFRRPFRFAPTAFGVSRAPARLRPTVAAPAGTPPVSQQQRGSAADWTAEEQRFLRALREAGL